MWDAADRYERFMGRWSRLVADELLAATSLPPAPVCLDLGCGTGDVSEAIIEHARPSDLVGIDPSIAFLRVARQRVPSLRTVAADAAALPLRDRTFELVVSGLVLNFVSEPAVALAEVDRVARPGAAAVLYVWDYQHPDFFLARFWDAYATVADVESGPDERGRWEICTEEGLTALAASTGWEDTAVRRITVPTRFRDRDELWAGFGLGVGPAGQALRRLADDRREAVRSALFDRLPVTAGLPVELTARALALTATIG